MVEDVLGDDNYVAFHPLAAKAGYRAVQSTPLIAMSGRLVGVVSTHFAKARTPSRFDMLMSQLYAGLAADVLARLMPPARINAVDRAHQAA